MSLPANLIKGGVAVAGAAAVAIVTVVFRQRLEKLVDSISKLWDGKRIAIIGRQSVGKTALLETLLGKERPAAARPTVDPESGGVFELQQEKRAVRYRVRHDLPGWAPANAYKGWEEDFNNADFVLYLFRADLVEQGDKDTVDLVDRDLNQLKKWLSPQAKTPRIILIGTHADQSELFGTDERAFRGLVRKARPIKSGAIKLNKADLIVGSLKDEAGRRRVIESLRRYVK
ncbi:hypothetical protein GCM10009775_36660 [Microbacterium aoyamense]|uniref:G domain-containing protein n=1 Tax=Microbacterium aoyamense TaxID=344166 RepID=A0ABP5BGF7_9MICO|nr:GTPase domain-containing protein [Microbacterium aoyamense]